MPDLFIVSKQQAKKAARQAEIEIGPLELTGNSHADAEMALRCIAFLIDFANVVSTDELRSMADQIAKYRGARHE